LPRADVRDRGSVAATVAGVNAVSAYVDKGDVTFEAIHERGAETIAREVPLASCSSPGSAPIQGRGLPTSD